jgi:glycosyltransferase involved in cell wall biosynthesis
MKPSEWLKKSPKASSDFLNIQDHSFIEIKPPNPVKLSVVTQFFPPDYAATGQLIEELVKHLGQQGVDVEVFTGQPGYAFQTSVAPAVEQTGRVRIKRSRIAQLWPERVRGKAINGVLFSIRTGLHLLGAYRRRNVVLLTTAPPFLPVLGYLAHLVFGLSYVCLLYDLYPDIAVELGVVREQHWLTQFWRAVNRQVWSKAKAIVVLSTDMKRRVVSNCPGIADKVSVIHSWSNPERIVPLAKQENWFAQEHQLVDQFTVLYSGNMGRCHDMDTILEAAEQLKGDPIRFVFIGGGAQRAIIAEQADRLGLQNFLFLPYQDRQVLPFSLTACDLSLVSISPGMEDLVAPSKLYSALSAGRPVAVVCPPHSYLNQLITDANCGTTFENGDGQGLAKFIRFLSADSQLAERMGRSGRQYLKENFTPETIARQYFRVLRRAIS